MINNLFIFAAALFMVIKGAALAEKYAVRLAEIHRLSKYAVGFIIVAVISILPEASVSINSAFRGDSSFGLGVLFGTSIADMTLIVAIVIFLAGRGLKVESGILKNHAAYPFILLLPLVLGFNGHFSRLEGIALIITGGVFYYLTLRNGIDGSKPPNKSNGRFKSSLMLLFSMAVLLIGSHFTVTSATSLADYIGVSPILIGMLIVGLGMTMPEFFFSLKSVKKHDDSLAVGDILGTVLADATIVVGIIALVNPFFFPQKIIYITGAFMVAVSFILFRFMRSGRAISKREAYMLLAFWAAFAIVEFMANT